MSLKNIEAKMFNKTTTDLILQYIKRLMHNDQLVFTPVKQDWFNT